MGAARQKVEIRMPADTRLHDLLMGLPLVFFSVAALAGFAIAIPDQWQRGDANLPAILSETASALFMGLQLLLVCIRRLPVNKATGFAPRFWAFAGANFGYALLLLPRTPLGSGMAEFSALAIIAGIVGSLISLAWLGRAFAIFPQARSLVTVGPYAHVRHPLYLFEQLAMMGMALQFQEPWSLIIAGAAFALQFPRMHYEEKILDETFAGYRPYARATPRLIPRIAWNRRAAFSKCKVPASKSPRALEI